MSGKYDRRQGTRVARTVSDPNRWQAQYYDPEARVWYDIGDSKATELEAREVLRQRNSSPD